MTIIRPVSKPLDRPIRLGVLISGGGTTLVNLVNRISDGSLEAEIGIVIASRPDCAGIGRAQEAGLPCEVVPRRSYATVADFSADVFRHLREADVDLVIFGGFLSLVEIPADFQYRVMNIHPALIPAFCGHGMYGHHVHEAAIARGVKVSGCTVHFADNEYDHGPIILQQVVPVLTGDSPDDLAGRVFQAECEAFPEAIRLFAAGRLAIEAGRVHVD
jgi:formyltetrahydrofolate-dependent phosphoribosylglycinamide formyltransferase